MPRYRATRPGWLRPSDHACHRRIAAGEEFEWSGPLGSWMTPLDDDASALVTEAKRRGRWRGLPHRLRGGADPVQRGQTKVVSSAQP
jgi:hypothetical protein